MRQRLITLLIFISVYCSAQVRHLGQNITYMIESNISLSDSKTAPFWFTNNKYGLSSAKGNSGYIRTALTRDIHTDSLRQWKVGFGVDLVVPDNYTADFLIHQLYGQIQYRHILCTIGAKELPMEFNDNELSSGDMTIGINARPIPQLRLELPDYIPINGLNNWVGIKAHIAFGIYTDNNWQEDFTNKQKLYSNNSLFHSKSIYVNIGKKEVFPITFTGGIQVASQFGGEVWNVSQRQDDPSPDFNPHIKMNSGLKGFWNALTMGGSDPNDGDNKNVEGNHLGSWHGSLQFHMPDWSVRGYFEHFFEDHSQLFFQYGWKDMTWGIEAELPDNPIMSKFVVELISTKDQTGGIYHDKTSSIPIQISGKDNYYYNHIYGGWQHWGMSIGNPLIISPIYNDNNSISTRHNRIKAIHIGTCGDPNSKLHYKLLYTHMRSWGTYDSPLRNTKTDRFLLAELTYKPAWKPAWTKGLSAKGAIGINHGSIIKNSVGFSLTLRKEWNTR